MVSLTFSDEKLAELRKEPPENGDDGGCAGIIIIVIAAALIYCFGPKLEKKTDTIKPQIENKKPGSSK